MFLHVRREGCSHGDVLDVQLGSVCGPQMVPSRATALVDNSMTDSPPREASAVIQTRRVTTKPNLEIAARTLSGPLSTLDQARASLPASAGLYAWWAATDVLAECPSPVHPDDPSNRLIYLGIATDLRRRIGQNHLRRSGTSTLRRTLAGLLLDQEGLRTRWTDRVVLVDADEVRLTAWMDQHLRLTWCTAVDPRRMEAALVQRLRPALNVQHVSGEQTERVKRARGRFYSSAGPRPK